MFKKIISHSLIYGLAPFIPKVINLLMLPIFTAVLNPVDYGVQSLLNSSMGLIGVLAMLGLNLPLTNVFFKHNYHYKKRWGQFYGFLNLWMVIYAVLLAGIIYCIVPIEAQENVFLIIVFNVVPIVLFGPTADIGQLYYQLNQQPKQVVIRTVIVSFITIVLNYVTIVILNLHYMGWFFSTCVSTLLLNASYWYPLHYKLNIRPIYHFKTLVIKKGLKVSLPMIPHYYGSFLLGSVDSLILKYYTVATVQIGFYGFAATFGNLTALFVGAINTAISPILFQMMSNKQYLSIRNLIWAIQGCFLIAVTVGCMWMKEIFQIVVKNDHLQTTYFLAIVFIMGHSYRPMYFGSGSFLFYNEKTRNLWKVTLGAGLVCVISNFLLIPVLGFTTPAYVLFFSYLIMGYGVFFLKDYKESAVIDFKPITWFFVTILCFALALFLVEVNYKFKLFISFIMLVFLVVFYLKKHVKKI
ncbi:lipopolysaccharide biosynthesis protein [Flavobacterium pectinovorum]|uniref:Lipopolysaccharide biosynthesis protein n=1 Tax=Flavobacterium pectinovorum TaxID=29533 RepID=A0A502EVE7_9FLAO|nr:lipopolysaccharide biosynthesis protein [Flavobacterium pectinovorum]TPG40091.1 lipopolysaccharide biosynthesis protein [Flavobacterium pectinovorum]